jgi:hypothetical protein
LLTGISLFLTLQAFRWQQASKEDEYKWKRQDLAISLLRDWDEKTSDRRNRIDRLQADLQGINVAANMPPISKELAAKIWSQVTYAEGNSTERELYDLRSDLISLLNYFESLSVAYYTEAANRELLEVSCGSPLKRWRKRLMEFTNYADIARNDEVWKPYYALTRDLERQSDEAHRIVQAAVLTDVGKGAVKPRWQTHP